MMRSAARRSGSTVIGKDEEGQLPKDRKSWRLLRHTDFHFLVWGLIFTAAPSMAIYISLPKMLQSADLADHITVGLVLVSVTGCVASALLGTLSDVMMGQFSRVNWTIICLIGLLLSIISVILFPDFALVWVLMCLFVGIALGACFSVLTTVLCERFGVRYFGSNWAGVMLAWGIAVMGLWAVFWAIYYGYIPAEQKEDLVYELVCTRGPECFRWFLLLCAGLVFCGGILIYGFVSVEQSTFGVSVIMSLPTSPHRGGV